MIPFQYKFLLSEGAPRMLVEALKEFGTLETPGKSNTEKILAWAEEINAALANVYTSDSIPWCGLFMAVIAKRAGKIVVKDPLWALNWGTFGIKGHTPMLGDILVFIRKGGGHVGLYVGEDSTAYHVLGGNQSDSVCITRILKKRLYAVRRPLYTVGQPKNVRRIYYTEQGKISIDEK